MANGESLTERKKLLIAQGAAYRLGIDDSRRALRAGLSVESIAKNAIGQVAMGAFAALKGGALLKGGNLQVLLPLVMNVISRLSKKTSIKPLARGALLAAVVAVVTRFIMKKIKASKEKQPQS